MNMKLPFCLSRIGVLIIDEKSHNTPAALTAAQRVRQDGINMIVIGVEVRYNTESDKNEMT